MIHDPSHTSSSHLPAPLSPFLRLTHTISCPAFTPTSSRWPLHLFNNTQCHTPSSHLSAPASLFLRMHKNNTTCTHITYTSTIKVTHTVSVALWYTFFNHQLCDWCVTHDQIHVTNKYMHAFKHTYYLYFSFIQWRISYIFDTRSLVIRLVLLTSYDSSFTYWIFGGWNWLHYLFMIRVLACFENNNSALLIQHNNQ